MAEVSHPFLSKKFVGNPVDIGTSLDRYSAFLMEGERIEMEFKGLRDAAIITDRRFVVIDPQGLIGKKVQVSSFPWKSVTAFSLENSGTFDLDAELKLCGSGWGVCEVSFTKGTDVTAIAQFINNKIL